MDRSSEMRSGVGRGSSLAASMVVAVLLIAPATTVTAQGDGSAPDEGDYVVVTGEDRSSCSGSACRGTRRVSDPRVSGDWEGSLDLDCPR